MREFVFRGKPKNEADYEFLKKMYKDNCKDGFIYGSLVISHGKYYICIMALCQINSLVDNGNTTMFEVIPETVGQCTGLRDKNGERIFEGDVFEFDDEVWESHYTSCGTEYDSWKIKNYGVVGFDEDRSCFDFVRYKFSENSVEADLHENHDIEFAEFVSELEVIGNIHDNNELMEENNNG